MSNAAVLVVEDDPLTRKIITRCLENCHYRVIEAENGADGWAAVEKLRQIDCIILDRMMPELDGMGLLNRIKQQPATARIPVVMQTSLASDEEVLEGLNAGVYYYLTKPFPPDTLIAIVRSAIDDHRRYLDLQSALQRNSEGMRNLAHGEFHLRTIEEATTIAALLSRVCPEPERVVGGLSELLINAVEHGNLEISYNDKSRLLKDGTWRDEIETRLSLPRLGEREVVITVDSEPDVTRYRIRDEGSGFDWQRYVELSPDRIFDLHGRGIALARASSFSHMEYIGCGNEVIATLNHPEA